MITGLYKNQSFSERKKTLCLFNELSDNTTCGLKSRNTVYYNNFMILQIFIFSLFWVQTDWSGGEGQSIWQDSTKYLNGHKIDVKSPKGKLKPGTGGFYKNMDFSGYGTGSISALNYISEDSSLYISGNFSGRGYVFRYDLRNQNLDTIFDMQNVTVNNIGKDNYYYFVYGKDQYGRGAYYYTLIDTFNWQYRYTDEWDITNFFFSSYSYRYYFSTYRYDRIYYGTDISDLSSYLNLPYAYGVYSYIFKTKNNTLLAFTRNIYLHYALNENISNFITYADTLEGSYVKKICEDEDSVIYAISEGSSKLFRSFNGGIKFPDSLWIDFGYPLTDIYSAKSGLFLIVDEKYILKSFDHGENWDTVFVFPQNKKPNSIVETDDYRIFISTRADSPFVYENYWSDYSYLESSVFQPLSESITGGVIWGRVFFTDSLTPNSSVKVKVRTDTLPDMSTATPWENCIPVTNSDSLLNYPSVKNGQRYIQYRIEFYSSDSLERPCFDEIKIEYEIDTTGPYIISAKARDGGGQQNGYENDDYIEIVFSEKIDTSLIINQSNIDSLFILSGNHHFSPFDSVVWKGERETLLIFMGNPRPDIPVPGDTITLSDKVKDLCGNPGYGWIIITGSYDDIYPPIVQGVLTDGQVLDDGIDPDDTLYFYFSEVTNTPYLPPDTFEIYFDLLGKSWNNQNVSLNTITWKNESTLCVTFSGSGLPSFFPGDSVHISGKVGDLNGNICDTTIYLTGSYDLKSPEIYSAIFYDYPPYGTSPNSSYDHFILEFDEKTNKPLIDSSNIDSILKLSSFHSWLSGDGKIESVEWFGDSILYIHPSSQGGYPDVSEGDTIYPDSVTIKDIFGNTLFKPEVIVRYVKVEEQGGNLSFLKIEKNILILFLNEQKEIKINIFDIAGRKILDKKYLLSPGIHKINLLKNFKKGIYFVEILVEKKQKFKLLKFK